MLLLECWDTPLWLGAACPSRFLCATRVFFLVRQAWMISAGCVRRPDGNVLTGIFFVSATPDVCFDFTQLCRDQPYVWRAPLQSEGPRLLVCAVPLSFDADHQVRSKTESRTSIGIINRASLLLTCISATCYRLTASRAAKSLLGDAPNDPKSFVRHAVQI